MIGISVKLKLYLVLTDLDLKPGLSLKTRLWLLLNWSGPGPDSVLCI